jgi:nucleoside-diphosphate-sugar epimerase
MKVLLTGAFGNIGQAALEELISRGHNVRCFDVPTKQNKKTARQYKQAPIEIVWGDLRNSDDVRRAVADRDVVLHLAFVIPTLSATGVSTEDEPEWAYEINVGGARNIIQAMVEQPIPPKLLFTSSLHVFGKTQHLAPPRSVSDEVAPAEHYSRHKVEVEQLVRASGLTWAIFRLGAAMPLRMIFDPAMFDVPLDNRIEFVHRLDVARALANALEIDEVWGRLWLIGGGPRNQYIYRDMATKILDAMGVGMLPDEAFSTEPYPTDWLDTSESQRVLQFQQLTLDDYVAEMRQMLGWRRFFVRLFRPAVRAWLLAQSPYYTAAKRQGRPVTTQATA